jgi:hypothetical protein
MSQTHFRRRAAVQAEHDAEYQDVSTPLAIARARRAQAKALRDQAAALDVEARALETSAPGASFSSIDRPAHTSRRTFNRECRGGRIIGAHKTGKVWTCSRTEWLAARAKRPAPRLELLQGGPSDEDLLRLAIASDGGRR